MSTLSSPRPSIASARTPSPTSSRRPSLDTLGASNASTPTTSKPQRRNRAALRDYYNLRPNRADSQSTQTRSRSIASQETSDTGVTATAPSANAELDNPNFDPSTYISQLLSSSSLSTILKAENSLISDIRTLDGERKALVYDNYSKLIKAVETIGKMRASMEDKGEPMIMTKTLGPAVGFVAETAGSLIREQEQQRFSRANKAVEKGKESDPETQTVKWVLDAPRRLRRLIDEGANEEADRDWKEVDALLQKWAGVKGVEDLRVGCEEIMMEEE
ncbi:hypothetical protein AJ80_02074 [Polytolypa hystricis UAMH7299]|uniref:Vacuolar protein sorting-associated protein 51 homolog n=1 Tax=Polytolypa hystricis (strain UAMH7299) TaxID=1447883 RepID=A0A2B7YQ73_POLH7|nr:hypothetical protein AJ80_02074 [Polytolypa hystricis UAMH7299]